MEALCTVPGGRGVPVAERVGVCGDVCGRGRLARAGPVRPGEGFLWLPIHIACIISLQQPACAFGNPHGLTDKGTLLRALTRAVTTQACHSSGCFNHPKPRGFIPLQQARALAPAIIFIDEIDAVGRSRGGQQGNDERDQTLNQVPPCLSASPTKP